MPWVIDGPCAVSTQSPQTSAQWPPRESRTPRAHERRRPLFDRGGEPIRRGRALRAAAPPACVDRQASHLPDGPEHGQHLARPAAPARHRASVLWRPWERRRRRAPHPAWVAAKLVAATPHPPAADRPTVSRGSLSHASAAAATARSCQLRLVHRAHQASLSVRGPPRRGHLRSFSRFPAAVKSGAAPTPIPYFVVSSFRKVTPLW